MQVVACQNKRCGIRKPINQMLNLGGRHWCCERCRIEIIQAETQNLQRVPIWGTRPNSFSKEIVHHQHD